MPYTLFQGGRRRRRRRLPALLALLLAVGGVAALGWRRDDDEPTRRAAPREEAPLPRVDDAGAAPLAGGGTAPSPLAVRLEDPRDTVAIHFKRPPKAGLVFDVDTGRVLWRHNPTRVLPIASLTKMMTALIVTDRVKRGGRVPITREALHYRGSGVGLLPRGKRIRVDTMLHGLLLPSGNDAAIALAQRAAGSVPAFVRLMNARAKRMGLLCTRFSSPHGLRTRGTHSCAGDLAALARAVLRVPRLARIVRRRQAVLPFPIKGGKLYLYNSNPLLRQGYRGVTGLKTGYTVAAGRCLVVTARRGPVKLGVVLLDSPDTAKQARQLLDRGFRVTRRR
jgi:D-alanyl-D-alanine carboxypeptidase